MDAILENSKDVEERLVRDYGFFQQFALRSKNGDTQCTKWSGNDDPKGFFTKHDHLCRIDVVLINEDGKIRTRLLTGVASAKRKKFASDIFWNEAIEYHKCRVHQLAAHTAKLIRDKKDESVFADIMTYVDELERYTENSMKEISKVANGSIVVNQEVVDNHSDLVHSFLVFHRDLAQVLSVEEINCGSIYADDDQKPTCSKYADVFCPRCRAYHRALCTPIHSGGK